MLGVLYTVLLVLDPLLLLTLAAWLSGAVGGRSLLQRAVRYSYGLVPLGFAIWLAHYSFHFFTGLFTIIPVTQNAVAETGKALLGQPRWTLTGLAARSVQPLQMGVLMLGVMGSLWIMYRLAEEDSVEGPWRGFAAWAGVCLLLFAAAVWLMFQPMEMRATFMNG